MKGMKMFSEFVEKILDDVQRVKILYVYQL